MPLVDTGARHYPFIRGVDHLFQFGVGHDACGEIAAGTNNARVRHVGVPLGSMEASLLPMRCGT